MNDKNRVVVTGIGVISSIGTGKALFWKNLLRGKSGVGRLKRLDGAGFRTQVSGEVRNFNPCRFMKNSEDKGRTTQFLLAAMRLAVKDAGLNMAGFKASDVGSIIGTTALEPNVIEEANSIWFKKGERYIKPGLISKGAVDTASAVIGREFALRGPIHIISTACSAGNYAIGYGFDLLRQNRAKIMFCSGVDVFFRTIYAGFNRLLITSPDICRPFDRDRKGTIIGEGSAVLVLETLAGARARKSDVYAEVLGYGLSCDAYNMTIPSKSGIKKCVENAIKNSKVKKKEIDYISAHGTGTVNNDRNEAQAIREVFGPLTRSISVSSIKSMLGHTIAAASAMEAAACCLSVRNDIIPPTVNLENQDPECRINIVANRPLKRRVGVALNNSFAFGGNNACVIFSKLKK